MRKGYLFATNDGAFSFTDRVPGVLENAKNAGGFTEITALAAGQRTWVEHTAAGNVEWSFFSINKIMQKSIGIGRK